MDYQLLSTTLVLIEHGFGYIMFRKNTRYSTLKKLKCKKERQTIINLKLWIEFQNTHPNTKPPNGPTEILHSIVLSFNYWIIKLSKKFCKMKPLAILPEHSIKPFKETYYANGNKSEAGGRHCFFYLYPQTTVHSLRDYSPTRSPLHTNHINQYECFVQLLKWTKHTPRELIQYI